MKTEVILFNQVINPGDDFILYERLKDNGRVIEVRVRFYPGLEKQLLVNPFLAMTGNRKEDLLTYSGNDKMLSGDDDYFVLPVDLSFNIDDRIAVQVTNLAIDYAYTLMCFVVVQYDFES